ncbi:MAG: biotin transporter BioY [Lachnospiraceae bacterium]|nr:biotin transporter BioY [Lachnospiraceae bacterium]
MSNEQSPAKTGIPVKDMTQIAIITALLCILAPMSIPIGPIPVSLTNLVIYLSLYVLGMRKGTLSFLLYLLIGAVGLPVFSGYTGGLAKLTGATGGYLVGFIFIALMGGYVIDHWPDKYALHLIAYVLSTAICYALGTVWFVYLMQCTLGYALSVCVTPFILVDLCKMVVGILVGPQVRRRLAKANVL